MNRALSEEHIILIACQPRSGSTLLQRLLAIHPEVATHAETWFLLDFLGTKDTHLTQSNFDNHLTQDALNETISKIEGQTLHELNRNYVTSFYSALAGEHSYFLDKTPRYYEILPSINELLPKSPLLNLVRHPLNVLDSMIRTWIDKGAYLGNHYRDLCVAPRKISQHINSIENPIVLRYEDLVEDPVLAISKLGERIGLDYSAVDLTLRSSNMVEGSMGDKSEFQKGEHVISADSQAWRQRLNDKKWKSFFVGYAHFLGREYFEQFGYAYPNESKRTNVFDEFQYLGEKGLLQEDLSQKVKDKIKGKLKNLLSL